MYIRPFCFPELPIAAQTLSVFIFLLPFTFQSLKIAEKGVYYFSHSFKVNAENQIRNWLNVYLTFLCWPKLWEWFSLHLCLQMAGKCSDHMVFRQCSCTSCNFVFPPESYLCDLNASRTWTNMSTQKKQVPLRTCILLHLKGNGESWFYAADLCKSLKNKIVLIYYIIERVIARYYVVVGVTSKVSCYVWEYCLLLSKWRNIMEW